MGIFDKIFGTGKSSAKRAQELANKLSQQGVDMQKQGLAFEMAKHEQTEPARLQNIFNLTQAGAGAGGLMNQLFQNEVLNPEMQLQGQMGGFSGLGQPPRTSQPPIGGVQQPGASSAYPSGGGQQGQPGGRGGNFDLSNGIQGQLQQQAQGWANNGVGNAGFGAQGQSPNQVDQFGRPRWVNPAYTDGSYDQVGTIPGTNIPRGSLLERPQGQPLPGQRHPLPGQQQGISPIGAVAPPGAARPKTTMDTSISKVGDTATIEQYNEDRPLQSGIVPGYAEAQDEEGGVEYTPRNVLPGGQPGAIPQAQGPSGELGKQLFDAFSPGGEFSRKIYTPGLVGEKGAVVTPTVTRDPQNFNYGRRVEGQMVDPSSQVQGRESKLGPQVTRDVVGAGEQVKGRMTTLPGLVGTGREVVDRARTTAQDPFEALIRGRRRDTGASNQYGGGQVQAGEQGARFLQAQAGSQAASGAQQMLEDRLYGQQMADREQRKGEILGIEDLRRGQGLSDRERQYQQRLGQQDLATSQGLQERQVGLEEARGAEALRREQGLSDRDSELRQKLGIEELDRGQRLSDRQTFQQLGLTERESTRAQDIERNRSILQQKLGQQGMTQQQQLSDRERQIQDAYGQRDLAQTQAAGGLQFSLDQAGRERDMLQRLGISERDKPFQQFSSLLSMLSGLQPPPTNPAGVAVQAGGNIGNIGSGLGANAAASLASANKSRNQMMGTAMGAAGAGGMFGGNIQGMYTGGGGFGSAGGFGGGQDGFLGVPGKYYYGG